MKRILSWVVLCLISWLVRLLTSLVLGLGAYIGVLIEDLSTFLKVLIYIFGGSTLISILFIPAFYGSALAVGASEGICESKKGTRYIVLSSFMLITLVVGIALGIFNHDIRFDYIITCVYYILLIIASRECV